MIPPWPATIALFLGFIITVSLAAAQRPATATGIAVTAIIVAVWLLRPIVDVREPNYSDRVYDRYFGIDSHQTSPDDITYKNIAIATGIFTLDTWISAALYHIKSGNIREINAFTVGRSPNQIGAPYWVDMSITLALGDRQSPEGRITQLGSAGHSRGGGRNGGMPNDVHPHSTKTFPGRFAPGTKSIVYAEGDGGFVVDHRMSVKEFAKKNRGNYLVVEFEFH